MRRLRRLLSRVEGALLAHTRELERRLQSRDEYMRGWVEGYRQREYDERLLRRDTTHD